MKMYNDEGTSVDVDKLQLDTMLKAGWSRTKPKPEEEKEEEKETKTSDPDADAGNKEAPKKPVKKKKIIKKK